MEWEKFKKTNSNNYGSIERGETGKYKQRVLSFVSSMSKEEREEYVNPLFAARDQFIIRNLLNLRDSWRSETDASAKIYLKELIQERCKDLSILSLFNELNAHPELPFEAEWRTTCIWISQYPDLVQLNATETEQYIFCCMKQLNDLFMKNGPIQNELLRIVIENFCSRGYSDLIIECWPDMQSIHLLFQSRTYQASSAKLISLLFQKRCQERSFDIRAMITTCLNDELGLDCFESNSFVGRLLNYECFKIDGIHLLLIDELLQFGASLDRSNSGHPYNILSSLLTIWSSPDFIQNASMDYQMRIAMGIISCCRIFKEKECEDSNSLVGSILQRFMDSIPKYLDATRQNVSIMGMVVAETVGEMLTPSMNLSFKLDKQVDLDWLRLLSKPPSKETDTLLIYYSIRKHQNSPSKTPTSQINNDVTVLSESESDDDEFYFPVRNEKDKTPQYIYHALKLIKGESPEDIQLGLEHLEKLIVRASDTEINEYTEEICTVVIHLQDDYNLDNFDRLWSNALVALCIREADSSCNFLSSELFSKDVPLMSKLRLMRVFIAVPMILENIPTKGTPISQHLKKGEGNIAKCSAFSSKTGPYYACIFASALLKRLSLFKNWDALYEQGHNLVLGQRLLNGVNLLIQISIHVCPLEMLIKYSLLLSSLHNHCALALEVIQGIRVFVSVVSTRDGLIDKLVSSATELISIAKEIAGSNYDENVQAEWNLIQRVSKIS